MVFGYPRTRKPFSWSPLHNLLIRQVEPVFQNHEADHHPNQLMGMSSNPSGYLRNHSQIGPFLVDLSGKQQQGVFRFEMLWTTRKKGSGSVPAPVSSITLRNES